MSESLIEARAGRALLHATRPFAVESTTLSWCYTLTTLTLLLAALSAAALVTWWPLRVALSLLGAGFMVRAFIIYHDYMHGSILRDSRMASVLFHLYAAFALTPTRSWRYSHNFHHAHAGQISGDAVGAFPLMTTQMWRDATPLQRAAYRASRHPLLILFGYVTVFVGSVCLLPLLQNPKRHWDSALALLAHGGLIAALWIWGGFDNAFYAMLLPMSVASILGSYLFFAQHSFKGMYVATVENWSFYRAALQSSSYLKMNRVMQWFTGNIGFHHVHHLNVGIPFYRLPETMRAIPALQNPVTVSLGLRDIVACFRSSLWDENQHRMVSYGQAAHRR
jgi:omega-6 fatty acid desaturase (delta-12 desaturase)